MTKYIELNNQLNIPENGEIPLYKDKEAVRQYFIENVNRNTVFFHTLKEKLNYLIDENYIDGTIIGKYKFDFIKQLFKFLYDKKFRFQSFMGAYKFYTQYAMKTNDNERYLERYEDRLAFNALMMGDGNEELVMLLADELINNRYQPATPTFLNAGKKNRGEFVSCFLIQVEDDMNSIGRTVNSALQLSKLGGGVGINLSNIRAIGDPIKSIQNASSGVVPIMKLLEDSFRYANQLGQRQGAGAVYLNIFHADVIDFLATRKENAESAKQVKMLSLGLVVPDKFYELVKNDENIHLFSPYDVSKEYNMDFSFIDITKEYDNLVKNPNIRSKVMKARDLDVEIGKLQQESGYPYIMNVDIANKYNPVNGKIIMSNLCSEILQPQTPSVLNDEQIYTQLGTDISCNLGSVNIPNLIETSESFEKSIDTAVRALTYITNHSSIETVPTVKNGNDKAHTIGLGAMGLHTLFAKNKIQYGSNESLEFTNIFFMMMNYYTLKSSNEIAKETQSIFFNFDKSDYSNGKYFDKYTNSDYNYSPKYKSVQKIFHNHNIPSKEDWKKLKENIQKYGLYHQNRLAVAPNGSISYVNETSASLHPIISIVEKRQEGKIGSVYYPAPHLSNETLPYYKSAYDVSMIDVINIYAEAQKHIDQGMSLTLFMRSIIPKDLYPWVKEDKKMSTKDLTLLRYYAWKKGIKSIYYVRTFTDDEQEIGITQCESCTI